MTERKAYKVLQKAWISEFNIEVGDKVRIVRSWTEDSAGWIAAWPIRMTSHVGDIGTISEINEMGPTVFGYTFPFFALELVSKAELVKEVTMADLEAKYGCKIKVVK